MKDNGCCCEDEFEVTDQSVIENPINPKKEIEEDFIKSLENQAHDLDIVSVGYAKIPQYILKGDELKYSNAIVFIMPISMDIINASPSLEVQKLNNELYVKFGKATYEISDQLREKGFETQVAHPSEGLIDLTRLAQEAGLGYIGKSRLLLMPDLGSRLLISAILTSIENLPFSNNNEHEWIRQYCKRCIKCIRGCLDEALVEQASLSEKANLIDGKCIGCSQGCTYCIKECIFSREDYKLIKAKQIRLEAKLREKGLL